MRVTHVLVDMQLTRTHRRIRFDLEWLTDKVTLVSLLVARSLSAPSGVVAVTDVSKKRPLERICPVISASEGFGADVTNNSFLVRDGHTLLHRDGHARFNRDEHVEFSVVMSTTEME